MCLYVSLSRRPELRSDDDCLHLAGLLVDLQLDCFKHYSPEMLAAAARLLRFEVRVCCVRNRIRDGSAGE
jgi:hypothetical protein